MPFASEFTPELSSDYLSSLLNPIEENERVSIGAARARGAAGGLGSQAGVGGEIGALESGAGTAESSAVSKFNLDVADKQYGERMKDEDEAYKDTERQKDEEFRRSMTEMGYQHEDAMAASAKHSAEQGQILGLVGTIGGAAVGGAVGGPIGASVGSSLGKGLSGMFSSPQASASESSDYDYVDDPDED